ncbi:MAG: hypothetical protein WC365_07300 [Candidatus Babeliales bacterium]|jgi:hypothetical protein
MKSFFKHPLNFITHFFTKTHNHAQNYRVRLWSVIITCIIIIATLVLKNQSPKIHDKIPAVHQLSAQEKNRATAVTVGLHINGFPNFSFVKNEFTIDGILWFKFQYGAVSLDTIGDFSIQNSIIENGEIGYKSAPIVKLIGDDVLVSYHIQSTFKTNLNFKDFPLENHRLNIIVQNKNSTPYELYFQSDENNLVIGKENLVLDWEPGQKTVHTGYLQANLELDNPVAAIRYPVAVFTIDFEGIGIKDFVSLYLPLFFLFFLAFCFMFIETSKTVERWGYIAAAFSFLVLFRLVIDNSMPSIGYNTHIDFIFDLLVVLLLALLFFQVYIQISLQNIQQSPEHSHKQSKEKLEHLNNTFFLCILITLSLCMIYSLFR